ncbi:hypothetical protein KJ885_02180 [Patescibacteria group bacterium]|nr:hypothetical protein [Patescibacteria group bacterium]
MDNQKKQLKIYESVNEFFIRAIELKESGKIKAYFEFLKKAPDHAPFNNTLVFIQNPNCGYYATASQWEKRFKRTVKIDARPMVALLPFGPVDFVYDIDDTEGEQITDEKILFWWRQNGGTLDEKIIKNTHLNLEALGVRYNNLDARKYFEDVNFTTGGYAQRTHLDNELSIVLHPRYSESSIEAYGLLCHEIAHILLGHLGQVALPPKKEDEKRKEIVKYRQDIPKHIKELEAELVAWIVFNSLGIDKNSESYIAGWLNNQNDISGMSMSDILRVAGKIQDMGRRRNIFR